MYVPKNLRPQKPSGEDRKILASRNRVYQKGQARPTRTLERIDAQLATNQKSLVELSQG
jgi:hypothetical protein